MSLRDLLFAADRRPGDGATAAPSMEERMAEEAKSVGLDPKLLLRPVNVDLSGGERKRNETVQLGALRPRFAVLDEVDSGLDVDALRAVARRIEAATTEIGLGVHEGNYILAVDRTLVSELPNIYAALIGKAGKSL